jgi:hypothetical protein
MESILWVAEHVQLSVYFSHKKMKGVCAVSIQKWERFSLTHTHTHTQAHINEKINC